MPDLLSFFCEHPTLDGVVHDATELSDPIQRRFMMSMMDNGTRRVEILPSVCEAMRRTIRGSERRRWGNIARKAGWGMNEARYVSLITLAMNEASAWLESCLHDSNSMLKPIEMPEGERQRGAALVDALPAKFFPSKNPDNAEGDKQMVIECCLLGKRLLISEDSDTIEQGPLNVWLMDNGFTEHEQLVMVRRDALIDIERRMDPKRRLNPCYYWAAACALREENQGDDLAQMDNLLTAFEMAKMHYVRCRLKQGLLNDPDPQATFDQIRASFPRRSRQTEEARYSRVRRAVRESGLHP